ncbi:hypothetical protein [Staphylococcus saccharolyticus]|uniref:Uncharacterized protein n=1 Tax=Staphylococcus saccharolyticus TaxID=33028 RepID=A0A380H2W2_9STAP|nr:hypothetical protein [Staphylococcus saccharolyticus]MBL7564826.1 hypothetical protein [Staphylococcus saccharolyticus]MBL7570910.1 hypothetical protein [Staphylococcus saccharolyticus]QQB98768.1 hypothetical protein I6I31_01635 [Staphylococcus saccharolyticus]QRJ67016.1 hypothetical protein DMB76_002710 [Staphylococcus saccharolyticus]RTX99822.1 hypothetical protein CD145_00760 [Staphylococcus saccharolyticus]
MKKFLIVLFSIGLVLTVICSIGVYVQGKKLDKDDRYNEKATTNLSETYHTSLNNIDIDAEVSDVTVKKGNEFAILSKGDDKKIKVNSKVNHHQWKISEYQTSTNINFRMQGNVYNHIIIIVPQNINNINIPVRVV